MSEQPPSPPRLLLDTAVPLLAVGGGHPAKEACARVLALAADGAIEAVASTEMIQEFVFHRLRRNSDPAAAAAEGRDLAELVTLAPFDGAVLAESLRLAELAQARGRDAVHAATAICLGLDAIVSPDRDFDSVRGLARVDPADVPEFVAAGRP
ncbi:MAG: type II toxin-antitoxin system VapC family toxin [Bifidobacteriaceae bacterium]|jgi:predicted nucleic acid-binding protein|nr:type II toxin-antitoxin system VapC family toxin [Bifidobacteriaceae bacterium]